MKVELTEIDKKILEVIESISKGDYVTAGLIHTNLLEGFTDNISQFFQLSNHPYVKGFTRIIGVKLTGDDVMLRIGKLCDENKLEEAQKVYNLYTLFKPFFISNNNDTDKSYYTAVTLQLTELIKTASQ